MASIVKQMPIGLMAIVAAISVILGLTGGFILGKHELSIPESKLNRVAATSFGPEQEFQKLAVAMGRYKSQKSNRYSLFPVPMRKELTSMGYSDPETDLVADLFERSDLIPYPGVLGGRMSFRSGWVINSERVLGYFDDGHIGGWAWLAFEIIGLDSIAWNLIYAECSDGNPVKPDNWGGRE